MSNWKKAYRSFYYETADDPDDIVLECKRTALLVIDIQNTYLVPDDNPAEAERWQPFYDRMNNICLLYTSPSPRDGLLSRMPSSA